MTSLFPMRLVSKAWNATFRDYSGTNKLTIEGESDLARLVKIMPNLSKLDILIESNGLEISLSPVSGCRQLSSLSLRYVGLDRHSEATFHHLGSLPSTLKTLSLDRAYVLPESFANDEFASLTKLEYLIARHREGSTCIVSELLQRLPNLKVTTLSY